MPFRVIKGTFHVVSRTKKGNPTGFSPDGDSIQFKPQNKARLDQLQRVAFPYRLSAIGSINLRIEGVDSGETHYGSAAQPAPLPQDARAFLLKFLGITASFTPKGKVKPPVQGDGKKGYILSKQLDVHGRPVAWVYLGNTPLKDGEEIELHAALAKRSYNCSALTRGMAYPLIYDTMYRELREAMTAAAKVAKKSSLGVWKHDPKKPKQAGSLADITEKSVLYPKLFRRLVDYYKDYSGGPAALVDWMKEKGEDDGVLVQPGPDPAHFSTVLKISGNKISFKHDVLDLIWKAKD